VTGGIASLRQLVRDVLAVAYKESILLRRNPAVIGAVVAQPVIFLLLFGFVLNSKPANVPWAVLDQSHSALSRRVIAEVQASGYFLPRRDIESYEEGIDALRKGRIVALLVLPVDLDRQQSRSRGASSSGATEAEAQILLDGADPIAAARVGGYIRAIAASVETRAAVLAPPGQRAGLAQPADGLPPIEIRQHFWFNPTLADRQFLLISLAGMLLTNLCLSLASFGLVAEREEGTWEQTLALPVGVVELVLGKLVPYVVLCYIVFVLSILAPGLSFGVWPTGSLPALVVLTLPFVLATLAVGVFISTISQTVAQSVFISVFAIMPSFVLSGVMMPYELMPDVPRWIGAAAPLRWYQIGVRRIYARGGGFDDVFVPMLVVSGMFLGLLALIRYRTKARLG
jgi:ABC-2 type transport system permease protein